jgi:hypothetical protein
MAAAPPVLQPEPEHEIQPIEARWTIFSSIVILLLFLDAVAITWYVLKLPESSFDHLHKTLTALAGWITSIAAALGIELKVRKQPAWRSLPRQLPVILIVAAVTVIVWFLLLPFHTLTIRVTGDDKPLTLATAKIAGEVSPRASVSDRNGFLELGGLSAAKYSLVISKQPCSDQQTTVPFSSVIFPGAAASVNLSCSGRMGLSSEPSGAMIVVDDAVEGATPKELNLRPGNHHFSVQLPNYVRQDFDAQLRPGERQTVYKKLVPIPKPAQLSIVHVEAAPDGVQIAIDGAEKGSAPLRAAVAPGEHKITARLGGQIRSKAILVPSQSMVTFDFRVQP